MPKIRSRQLEHKTREYEATSISTSWRPPTMEHPKPKNTNKALYRVMVHKLSTRINQNPVIM